MMFSSRRSAGEAPERDGVAGDASVATGGDELGEELDALRATDRDDVYEVQDALVRLPSRLRHRRSRVPRALRAAPVAGIALAVALAQDEDAVDELARVRVERGGAVRERLEDVVRTHVRDLLGERREELEVLRRLRLARGDDRARVLLALRQRAPLAGGEPRLDLLLEVRQVLRPPGPLPRLDRERRGREVRARSLLVGGD